MKNLKTFVSIIFTTLIIGLFLAHINLINFISPQNNQKINTTGNLNLTKNKESFPINELGSKAQNKMNQNSFAIQKINDEIIINSDLQKLKGIITQKGLNIESTAKNEKDLFSIKSNNLHRKNNNQNINLDNNGKISINNNNIAVLTKKNIHEEFTTSGDGIRQDFVIKNKIDGDDNLILALDIKGASISQTQDNRISLTLDKSQRKLIYHNLKVIDANNQTLLAKFTNTNNQINIEVDDKNAAYPITIDPTITDSNWISMGVFGGVSGNVSASIFDSSDNLYIGGLFMSAGGLSTYHVAKWDGTTWSALGSGTNAYVEVLALDSSNNLYAGGSFTTAGGVAVNNIAKWDGTTWSALGSGTNASVVTLALDSSNNLYAGGSFTTAGGVAVNNIAKWDGTTWSALGGGINGSVMSLITDSSDKLYVSGIFSSASGTPVNNIAKWDGAAWSALGGGVNNFAYRMTFDSLNNLYVGGFFSSASGTPVNNIAKWDGAAWSALGGGLNSILYTLNTDSSNNVYVGGAFTTAGGVPAQYFAKWDGAAWSALGEDLNGYPASISINTSDDIYIVGSFTISGDNYISRVARWNNFEWEPVGYTERSEGIENNVNDIEFDSNNNLYAGGQFIIAGGTTVNRIAKWDGSTWSALDEGMNDQVWSIFIDNNDNIYAGGNFTTAGGISANRIAKWNGETWSALGGGMNGLVEEIKTDINGTLYAVGEFTTASSTTVNHIARWDGATWSALGNGLNNFASDLVFDTNNNMYIVGNFTTAGGVPANRVAKWDGSAWSALGDGLNNYSEDITIDDNDNIYVVGNFTTAGGVPANRVAKWDGSAWSALGDGADNRVFDVIYNQNDNNLYIGGTFVNVDGIPANRIAKWNGSAWSAMGDGADYTVLKLSLDLSGNLYAGGNFQSISGQLSPFIAKCMTAPYMLNYSPGSNGSVAGTTSQSVGYLSSGSTVTAIADPGFRFVNWGDGSTQNPRTDTNITTSLNVTANFEAIPNSSNIQVLLPPSSGAGGKTIDVGMDKTINLDIVKEDGTNLLGYINSKANFGIKASRDKNTQEHTLKISKLDLMNNIVTIEIHSDPITIDLKLDETMEVDIDNDGINDLMIKFEDLHVNRVELGLFQIASEEKINEESPSTTPETIINKEKVIEEKTEELLNEQDIDEIIILEAATITNDDLYNKLKGRIILKVEDEGKAYYISTTKKEMYYLGRPDDAFQVMRKQGIGITNDDLFKIGEDKIFTEKHLGKIFLQIEKMGEAWYVNPGDKEGYYLGRPRDAFNIMKNLGLGISNNDFNRL